MPCLISRVVIVVVAIAGLLGGTVHAQVAVSESTAAPVSDVLVIMDVRVFDGARVIDRTRVLIRDGLIRDVGPDITPPDGAAVVDGAGKTLLPGLIDAHTHVIAEPMLRQALWFGVTLECDMFMSHQLAAALRGARDDGRADLVSAGTLVTSPGGHGTQFGLPIPTITKPDEAQAFVDARIAEGSDYIKIVYDDGHTVGIQFKTISKAVLRAVIEAAHRRGRMAVVHIGDAAGAMDAIEAGADGLVHLFADVTPPAGFAERVKKAGAFVIPTLTVLESVTGEPSGKSMIDDAEIKPFLSKADERELSAAFPVRPGTSNKLEHAFAAMRQLSDAGVPVLAGSDAPNPGTMHGASLHRELELMVRGGFSPIEALTAATSATAQAFGLKDRGRIEKGMRADLVLVEGDPTGTITDTRHIVGVWKGGARLDRDAAAAQAASRRKAEEANRAPVPAGSEDGLVSDFEDGTAAVKFGMGWSESTDAFVGAKSTMTHAIVDGGARGSGKCLYMECKLDAESMRRWAGMMFAPGPGPMAPADLSGHDRITFWARGEGQTASIILFDASLGFAPVVREFKAEKEWTRHSFAIRDFSGLTGESITGVYWGGGADPGEFKLWIDDVRFEKE